MARRTGLRANARSIVAVMLLAAAVGSTVAIETSGPDEREAIDALSALIGSRFAAKAVAGGPDGC
jgi:phosphocarrier protein HPr